MHDQEEGGYFRTCSNADWSRPHREKLLGEQAGLLANCLRTFRITQHSEYALMAEDIIGYIDRKLSDSANQAFTAARISFAMKLRKVNWTENILRSSTTASTPMPMPRPSAPISKQLSFWESQVTKSAR